MDLLLTNRAMLYWIPQKAPEADLIDECIITIIPKILHKGIALPSDLLNNMSKVSSRQFFQGIVEKKYIRKKD